MNNLIDKINEMMEENERQAQKIQQLESENEELSVENETLNSENRRLSEQVISLSNEETYQKGMKMQKEAQKIIDQAEKLNTIKVSISQREEECRKTEQRQLAIGKQQDQQKQALNAREQEMNREVKKRARELIKDEKEELDKKKKQNKRNFNILSAIVVIIGCITLLFSTFILHKANAIATPKKAELASISKIKKENRNLKASISSSERKQAQASSQAAAQKASESQAQAEIAASVKEQSDNDAKIGQLRKEIDELSDSDYPENHMPILPPEEVQRLKANFTRERYNQLLTELEQMKKEKKIGFKDSSDLQSELGLINDRLKKQGK